MRASSVQFKHTISRKGSGQGAFGQQEPDAQNRQLNDEANDKDGETGQNCIPRRLSLQQPPQ